MPDESLGALYARAMKVTTQDEADALLQKIVTLAQSMTKDVDATAEMHTEVQRKNLAYHAGYYPNEVRERVERLFKCAHPYFGSIAEKGPPTMEEAFNLGVALGKKHRGEMQ